MRSRVLFVVRGDEAVSSPAGLFAGDELIEVVTAGDGAAALELLGTQEIDLIVSDERAPQIDGSALLGKVRQLFPELPRVLLTDKPDTTHAQILAELGGRLTILRKPCDDERLRETVRNALAQAGLPQEERDLIEIGGVTPEQLERGRRIRQRLHQQRSLAEVMLELESLAEDKFELIARVRRSRMSLVELLQDDGVLDPQQLLNYRRVREQDPSIDDRELLVGGGLVSEESYLRALCSKHGIPYEEPEVGVVDMTLLAKSSVRYLMRQKAFPVFKIEGKLAVILNDPLNLQLRAEIERIFGMPIDVRCCIEDKIVEGLRTLDRLRGGKGSEESSMSLQYREIENAPAGEENGQEAVQIVDYLLGRAIRAGASDLHIEPQSTRIRVRLRIDGVLTHLTDLPIDFAPRVVSRIKILAGADISERRLHQDGKIFVKVDGNEVDIRVSTYVTIHGETIVMRLLDRNRGILGLEQIGFTMRAHAALTDVVLESSSGLVLLVGPTGSGKTSTLYGFIQHANDPAEKVITCEDPVEFVIDGIVQCSVNSKTGPTFADSLRAIVRQDPDSIVVGEMRDPISVGLALECALTGHKVFSTFHTEDAVGAFIRMLEMGAEPFLVASTVAAVVAQRLVRRLCSNCRIPADPLPSELRFLGIDRSELRGNKFYAGKGCGECSGSGFRGRRAIHEVLLPNDDLRDAVMHRLPAKELREHARKLPEFLTLQEDGVLKALAGDTSLSEVVGNAPRDTAARPLSELKLHNQSGRIRS